MRHQAKMILKECKEIFVLWLTQNQFLHSFIQYVTLDAITDIQYSIHKFSQFTCNETSSTGDLQMSLTALNGMIAVAAVTIAILQHAAINGLFVMI